MGRGKGQEREITIDEMIEWVKKDPEKVKRLIKAEEFIGSHGKIEVFYHDGVVNLRAQPSIRV